MKITIKNPIDLVNDMTIKKVILAGVALFVINLLVGLATAKAQDSNNSQYDASQEISTQN